MTGKYKSVVEDFSVRDDYMFVVDKINSTVRTIVLGREISSRQLLKRIWWDTFIFKTETVNELEGQGYRLPATSDITKYDISKYVILSLGFQCVTNDEKWLIFNMKQFLGREYVEKVHYRNQLKNAAKKVLNGMSGVRPLSSIGHFQDRNAV